MNRQLRARLLLEEAHVLGVDLADLVAAATGQPTLVTVTDWIAEIAPTFSPSTAATYRPYWRLAVRLVGDHRLAELTTTDLAAVVDAAAERARAHRPDSTGRASRETCVAALRALYARAVDAGHVTTNPAAALSTPAATSTPPSPTSRPPSPSSAENPTPSTTQSRARPAHLVQPVEMTRTERPRPRLAGRRQRTVGEPAGRPGDAPGHAGDAA